MIAITGASGFLGSYISNELPFPQKRLSRCPNFISDQQCQWVQGDLCQTNDFSPFVKGTQTLFHLACTSNPRTSNQNMIQDIDHNVISSLRLFESFARHNPEGHIIFTSSGGNMYEAGVQGILRSEEDTPSPRSGYAIHKLTLEHYLKQICEKHKMRGTILRISNPYGTLLSTHRIQGLIGVAFAKLLTEEELPIFDSLETVRDYIHLSDVARAFKLVLETLPSPGECRLFNLSSGQGFTNGSVLELIEKTTCRSIKKHFPSQNQFLPTWSILSYKKIHQALGWEPTITLAEGIKSMWKDIAKELQFQPNNSG